MTRLKMIVAAGIGFGAAYFLDPDRGRSRRAQLADQTRARLRAGLSKVRARAEYQKGVAKGTIHRITEPLRPEKRLDGDTLVQKVRSEAIGQWKRTVAGQVEIHVEADGDNGAIRLTGEIGREEDRDRLLKLVRMVDGVDSLDDRTVVAAG